MPLKLYCNLLIQSIKKTGPFGAGLLESTKTGQTLVQHGVDRDECKVNQEAFAVEKFNLCR